MPNRQKTWRGGKQFNVDLRGDGGYIMAPGSTHPRTGKLYTEVTPWTLDLLMSAPVYDPSWLPCERAAKPTKKTSMSVPVAIAATDHVTVVDHVKLFRNRPDLRF